MVVPPYDYRASAECAVMNAPIWDRVKHVFQQALDRPPYERAAYVRELCGDDQALREEVDSLLATHEEAASFAERPAVELLRELGPESRPSAPVGRVVRPGDRLGVYEIQAVLGAGGMGEVYKARDTRLGRTVAIKVLPTHLAADRDRYQRFDREARAVANLDHPHIGALFDIGQDDGLHFLVLQYLEGETLASRLAKGALPLDQALRHATDIADALDHAHRRGIVHRDLKPGNIFLTKAGATLLDFGLAKWRTTASGVAGGLTAEATARDSLTEAGMIVGTLHYMAPEQIEGKGTDARTDLFAFGAAVYEMVTGSKAFDGGGPASVVAAILDTQPPSMSTLRALTPSALDHIVMTCLAKDPDERWQSAGDVARHLRWIAESSAHAPPVGAASASWWNRRSVLSVGGGLLVGSLIGGAAVWSGMRARSTTPPLQITRSTVSTATPSFDDLTLSHDGTRLAYVGERDGKPQIYVRALDEFDTKAISGTEFPCCPFFSPDGRWLAFFDRDLLKKVAVSGGAPQVICESQGGWGATWGPDDTIIFAPNQRSGLMRVAAAGGTPQAVTTLDSKTHEKSHRFPQFLPGGKAVLFTITTPEITSFDEARVAVVSLETGRQRILFDGGTNPRFVSTGHLLYARGGSLVAVLFDPQRLEVNSQSVPVVDDIGVSVNGAAAFDVAKNGLLAYDRGNVREKDAHLVWVDRNGAIEPLLETRRPFYNVSASPNGQQLAVTIYGPNDHVWVYDLARRTLSRLTVDWNNQFPTGRQMAGGSCSDPTGLARSISTGNRRMAVAQPSV
jgi:serine/threonine protein kinase